ncbi:MAG: hypothetical protein FJ098_01785 [Deltaproteobacteria bacterium]|nr:hypothetical protein [Deltaproteobacteria bacterium]
MTLRSWVLIPLSLVPAVMAGCSAPRGDEDAVASLAAALQGKDDLRGFLTGVAQEIRTHDWEGLLRRASPPHYESQVTDLGMGHPQYLAELLGLHTVGNSIKRGETVTWSDLKRLDRVRFLELDDGFGVIIIRGEALLADGSTLKLELWIGFLGGEHVLTGGVG